MKRWILSVTYVLAYVAADAITYVQPVLKLGITPWSPQAGLTVAYLFLLGPRWAPVTALAALLAELLVRDAQAGLPAHALASVWIAASYAALAMLRGPALLSEALVAMAPAVRFVAATVVTAGVAALGYVGSFLLTGALPMDAVFSSVLRYWIGDVNGILMLSPLLLALPQLGEGLRAVRRGTGVALAQTAVVMAAVWLLFDSEAVAEHPHTFYPLFVPLIWIAVRWGAVGALLAAVVIQVGIVVAMRDDALGPPLFDLQALNLTLAVTGLMLGVAVTERARARLEAQERDRQLARAMRFAVAGEMASALTHELNQPITALVSYLQASQIMSAPVPGTDARLNETLGKATREAIRAAEVLRRLRDFYQGTGPPMPGPADAVACCTSVLELLEPRLRRRGVVARFTQAPHLPQLAADRTQIEMVLHNLVTNAIDAMGGASGSGGELLVDARVDAGQVVLAVHDAGPGVDEDALGQMFEPFNTTKPDGMGLGLAICRNLMRAQGGDVTYRRSEILGGACFELRCPRFQ
jgi:two-component system sensor kinase FixL